MSIVLLVELICQWYFKIKVRYENQDHNYEVFVDSKKNSYK
jgi:hypothetical protein